jgi:hypothetical protein
MVLYNDLRLLFIPAVLPDSGVHRYFAQIYRKIKPVSGDILIAVALSIFTNISGKLDVCFVKLFEIPKIAEKLRNF